MNLNTSQHQAIQNVPGAARGVEVGGVGGVHKKISGQSLNSNAYGVGLGANNQVGVGGPLDAIEEVDEEAYAKSSFGRSGLVESGGVMNQSGTGAGSGLALAGGRG